MSDAAVGRRSESAAGVDLYETLQVSPNANQQVIRAAYRTLARDFHPDVNVANLSFNAQRRIRELNAAYDVLSNPERRAEYDLARLRVRRHERAPRSERGGFSSGVVASGQVRKLPDRTAVEIVSDGHFSALRGGTVIVLTFVVVLTMLLILLLWNVIDPGRDELPSGYTPAALQLSHP